MRVAELGRVRDLCPRSLGLQWNRLRPRSKMEQKQSMSFHSSGGTSGCFTSEMFNMQVAIASKASVQTISQENQDLLQITSQKAGWPPVNRPHKPVSFVVVFSSAALLEGGNAAFHLLQIRIRLDVLVAVAELTSQLGLVDFNLTSSRHGIAKMRSVKRRWR